MATIYARLQIEKKFKYQTLFSAKFDKQDIDGQMLDETELYINLNNIQILTEGDNTNIDNISPLEIEIQKQEIKNGGWRCDKINSRTIDFNKTIELSVSSFIKILLRYSVI